VLRLRALDRRRAHHRPPVRELAGVRLDTFRREVYRDGRYVALTWKQFAVLEVLVAAEGGVISAEELLERAWDENADPFTTGAGIGGALLSRLLFRAASLRRSGSHRAGVRPAGWVVSRRPDARPLARITDATRMAATGSLSHRIRLPGRRDEFRELADAFDTMLAQLEAHVAQQ
jgi:HAMP domain-containing protein